MSVYVSEHDDLQGFGLNGHNEKHCSNCAGVLQYPFLGWAEKPGIFLCGKCCLRWRDGLIADLIHCAAVVEIQQLRSQSGDVLVRKSKRAHDEERSAMETGDSE